RGGGAGGGLRAHQLRSRPSRLDPARRRRPRVSFALRLTEDRLSAGTRLSLPRGPRILYVRRGAARIELRPPTVHAGLAAPATTKAARIELGPPTVHAGLAAPATTNAARIELGPPAVRAGLAASATTNAARIEVRPPTVHAGLAAPTPINTAWHGTGEIALMAGAPAVVLRFELLRGGADRRRAEGDDARPLLRPAIE